MADEPITFEDAMARLERIVADLESGTFSLEDSIKKFEDGIRLGKTCRDFLDHADVRVRTLSVAASGEPGTEAPMDNE